MEACRFGCSSSEEDDEGLVRHSHLSSKAGACAEGPSELRRLSSVPIYLMLTVKEEKQLVMSSGVRPLSFLAVEPREPF